MSYQQIDTHCNHFHQVTSIYKLHLLQPPSHSKNISSSQPSLSRPSSQPTHSSSNRMVCFPSSAPTVWGTYHLVLNLSSNFFQSSGSVRQVKYSSGIRQALGCLGKIGTNLQVVVQPTSQ